MVSVMRSPESAYIHGSQQIARLFATVRLPSVAGGGRRVASASSSVKPLERVRCGLTVLLSGSFFQPPRLVGHPEDHLDDRQVFLADHAGGMAFSCRSWPHQSAMFSGVTRCALSWPGWSVRLSIFWQKSPTVRGSKASAGNRRGISRGHHGREAGSLRIRAVITFGTLPI